MNLVAWNMMGDNPALPWPRRHPVGDTSISDCGVMKAPAYRRQALSTALLARIIIRFRSGASGGLTCLCEVIDV